MLSLRGQLRVGQRELHCLRHRHLL